MSHLPTETIPAMMLNLQYKNWTNIPVRQPYVKTENMAIFINIGVNTLNQQLVPQIFHIRSVKINDT